MPPETATPTRTSNPVTTRLNDVLESSTVYAHFPLRIALVSVFLFHGISKFVGGIDGFAAMMGLPYGVALLVALGELAIPALAIYGAFGRAPYSDSATRTAGLVTMVIMVGAISIAHWPRWSFVPTDEFPMGGMEFQTVLVLIGLYMFLRGNRV